MVGEKFAQGAGSVLGRLGGKEILPIEEKKRWHSCTGGQKGDGEAENRVRGEVARGGTSCTRREGVPLCELCEEMEGVLLWRGKFAQETGSVLGRLWGKEILPIEKKKRWHSCTGGQKGDGKAKNGVRGEVAQGGTFGTRKGEA